MVGGSTRWPRRARRASCALALAALAPLAACSGDEPAGGASPAGPDASSPEAGDAGALVCASDADCAGGRVCDPASRTCVAPCNRARCAPESHCDEGGRLCVPGCSVDEGCRSATVPDSGVSARRCDAATHTCVECTDDVDCAAGSRCQMHACVDGCSDAQPCPRGQACCGGACVDPANDDANCGGCAVTCARDHSVGQCVAGSCVLTACTGGEDGGATTFADCDRDFSDGCEVDLQRDARNCGACGVACDVARGTGACALGECVVTACDEPARDCDGAFADGCEADVQTSVRDCGACGHPCPSPATEECLAGVCGPSTCPGALRDCDADPKHDCETDTSDDPSSCGGCGLACELPHATASCVASACAVAACDAGFADCNADPADGCEIDLRRDVQHCGACDVACAAGRSCGRQIVASMAAVPTHWRLNGSAFQDVTSGGVVLNLPGQGTAGTIFYDAPFVIDAVSVSFEFLAGFAAHVGTDIGSDGLGFVLQTSGASAVGSGGGGMGMAGLGGYGVELDTFRNVGCDDPNSNHVAVSDLALGVMCQESPRHLAATASLPFSLRNSGWHTVEIEWVGAQVDVALDHVPVLAYAIASWTPGTSYTLGFTGAGGFNVDLHEVRNVRVTFPSARCL